MPARSGAAAVALLVTCSTIGSALASSDSEISPMLKGDANITYSGTYFNAALREQGIDVGAVTRTSQSAAFNVRFGVAPGVEAYIGLPIQMGGAWQYSNVSGMSICPVDTQPDACTYGMSYGTALMLDRDRSGAVAWFPSTVLDETAVPTYSIGGAGDLALGLRFAPFSSRYLGRGERRTGAFDSKANWVIDFGLMVPVGAEFFTPSGGDQGAANGKVGFRFRTAMSKRMNNSEPYVSFEYRHNSPYDTYILESDIEATQIDPPDEIRFFTGTELIPYEDEPSGSRFGVDLAMGYHLRTQGVWASGYLLPNVLTEEEVIAAGLNPDDVVTFGEAVQIDEQMGVQGRARLRFDAFHHVKVHLGVALGYYLPSRVERAYNVRYGQAIGVEYEFGITGNW